MSSATHLRPASAPAPSSPATDKWKTRFARPFAGWRFAFIKRQLDNRAHRSSPYLADANRLADVIAAIQAMATYKFYKLDFERWADRIVGDGSQSYHWRNVFEQHPEFFRLDSKRERASLVWRRQHQKRYHVDEARTITTDEYDALADTSRISRTPLGTAEIATLLETATNLHSRALEHQRERRAWIHLIVGFLGAVLGAAIAALVKG